MKHKALREECCEANRSLPSTGLVDLTFGNVSVFDPGEAVFAIKPSGVPYNDLAPSDMVVLDLEGKIVSGDLRPSSDTPTHRCLFAAFGGAGVRSVVHTHSKAAVAFAQAGRSLPCLGTTHADYFFGPVPVTRFLNEDKVMSGYEWETGRAIVECFVEKSPLSCPAVLVRGHGPFAWGETGQKAVETACALEIVAEMALRTLALDSGQAGLPDHILHKHFYRKHGEGAYYGQPAKL